MRRAELLLLSLSCCALGATDILSSFRDAQAYLQASGPQQLCVPDALYAPPAESLPASETCSCSRCSLAMPFAALPQTPLVVCRITPMVCG